jgi:hypothetical protein
MWTVRFGRAFASKGAMAMARPGYAAMVASRTPAIDIRSSIQWWERIEEEQNVKKKQSQQVKSKIKAISGNCRFRLKNGRESYEYRND